MRHKKYSSILDLADEYGQASIESLIGLQDSLKQFRTFENSQNYAARFCDSAREMLQRVELWQRVPCVPARAFFDVYDEVLKQEIGISYMRPAPLDCGFWDAFTDCFGVESTSQDYAKEGELIVVRIPNIQLFERKTFSMTPYCALVNSEEIVEYLPRFLRRRYREESK